MPICSFQPKAVLEILSPQISAEKKGNTEKGILVKDSKL